MSENPDFHLVERRTLTRRNIEASINAATKPIRLIECDLDGVDLSRLDISSFVFERCSLIEIDLAHAKASNTRWISCRARKAQLRGIDLTDAIFQSGDWNNSDWDTAQLAGASLNAMKLTGASFQQARCLGTTFHDCLMISCQLSGLSFKKSKLGRCDMSRADLRRCDMREAMFDAGSSIAGALITEAKFEGTDLRQVDLAGHGIDALKILRGARISPIQAATIVTAAGLKVG